VEQAFLAGTPRRVAELVDELKDIGARNVMHHYPTWARSNPSTSNEH